MRRQDREVQEKSEVFDILNRCDVIHIGMYGDTYPYVVPVSFGMEIVAGKAEEGMTVVFISSEIEEMLRTVNKLCVLRDGAKVGELKNDKLTQEDVMAAIAGGEKK